ncbi:MAG: hypothetical protein KGN38_03520 [Actinomycetales bacterium]|nr:hypothetical protein [Actinomycetales bacterium]
MYVSDEWSGDRPRRLVSILLASLFVALLAIPYLRDLTDDNGQPSGGSTPWFIAAGVAGVLLLASAVYSFVKARTPRTGLLEALPSVIVLLAPVPGLLGLQPELGLIPVLVAFLLMIRDLARGHAMAFSIIAILGILLVSSVFMADVEDEAGEGRMKHWWQAMFWGAGQIFRFHRSVSMYAPKTDLGNWIGLAVVAAGVLFSAVLLSALTSWAVNSARKGKDDKATAKLIASAVDRAVERALLATSGPEAAAAFSAASAAPPESAPEPMPGERRVWIDVERVVGSGPLAWWQSRRVTVPAYVERLRASDPSALPTLVDGERALLVAVVEGGGRSEAEGESVTASGQRLLVVHAPGSTSDEILERVRAGDVVVTDNPELLRDLGERDVTLVAPVGAPPAAS